MTLITIGSTIMVFLLIYYIHQYKLHYYNLRSNGFWDIPLQPIEFILEFRMYHFFADNVLSARVVKGFYVFFATLIVMAYSSMLRSALVAQELEEPLDTIEVLKLGTFQII